MGGFSKGVLAFSVAYFGLVLLKDGTLEKLTTTAAQGTRQFLGGIKPITGLA